MPYKKKFKLPGPTWNTFIKINFFADIRKNFIRNTSTDLRHFYKQKFLVTIKKKKKFLETMKKNSSQLYKKNSFKL